jgi:HAD superfamily phosphatase (TIGR01668 family)
MKIHKNVFFPDMYLDSIFKIDYEELFARGMRGLVYDIDNTLAEIDRPEPNKRLIALFDKLKQMGYAICLLSNNNEGRVKKFNEKLKLHAIHRAAKPRSKGIKKAMSLLGTDEKNTVMIGDQIFTDVWVGKRHGLYTILVRPVAKKDEFTVTLKRWPEKIVLALYRRKARRKKGG